LEATESSARFLVGLGFGTVGVDVEMVGHIDELEGEGGVSPEVWTDQVSPGLTDE